jgi:hypothetical protein
VSETGYVVLYGIVAAFSPTVLLATLVVLGSGRGRLNGLVFLIAFLLGQSLAYLVAFLIGSAITFGDNVAGNVTAALEVVGGIALVAIAWQRREEPLEKVESTPRSQTLLARLSHVRPAVSFGVGMPLGVGVKRLVITFLAAATVASADLGDGEDLALGLLYIAIASVVVWCPVLVYLILGSRSDSLVAASKEWITANERRLLVGSAFALGLFLILDGIAEFL